MTTFPRTFDTIRRGIAAGLHIGAQLCILHHGRPLLDEALGNAAPGRPMTPDTLMIWRSAGKPLTAAVILQLAERGRLTLEDSVAKHIPEFAAHGKDAITLRQVLTHTAGLRWVDLRGTDGDWPGMIARIASMRPEPRWLPGEKLGYSPLVGWLILGEVIQRVTGRPVARVMRDQLLLPLELNATMAVAPDEYAALADQLGVMVDTSKSPPVPSEDHEHTHSIAPNPGLSLHGSMRALARFYEMLRRGGERAGVRVLSSASVAEMTRRQYSGLLDQTFKTNVDMGLGLLLNTPGMADFVYGYGPGASLETFGHGGSQSSTAFCDPTRAIVVAACFNGMPGEHHHAARMRSFFAALWSDLAEK